jgi:hypothetical protein
MAGVMAGGDRPQVAWPPIPLRAVRQLHRAPPREHLAQVVDLVAQLRSRAGRHLLGPAQAWLLGHPRAGPLAEPHEPHLRLRGRAPRRARSDRSLRACRPSTAPRGLGKSRDQPCALLVQCARCAQATPRTLHAFMHMFMHTFVHAIVAAYGLRVGCSHAIMAPREYPDGAMHMLRCYLWYAETFDPLVSLSS